MPKKISVVKAKQASAAPVPPTRELKTLAQAAKGCRACPLWKRGTQTVFGEGRRGSRILFVAEQPGDNEDSGGRPSVAPSGAVRDRARDEAGKDRQDVHATNPAKH